MEKIKGFSLIELLVVIAIIAILAGLAVPAYNHYVVRSRVASTFSVMDMIITKQKVLYGKTGSFAGATQLGLTTGAQPWLLGNPTQYGPYYYEIIINGRNSGSGESFTCSDGTQFSEQIIYLNNPAIGYNGYIAYMVLMREVNGTFVTKCFYRSDYISADIAARYLPSNCQTPATNAGGTQCFLPW